MHLSVLHESLPGNPIWFTPDGRTRSSPRSSSKLADWLSTQPDGMYEVMTNNLTKALADGQFGIFVGNPPEDKDRLKFAAYRELAGKLGIKMGKGTLNPNSGTVTAPLSR